MTMTDAEIGHARSARSSDTKAAIEYLRASGATAIIIIEIDGICTISIGTKINPKAISVQWIVETLARSIVKQARHDAGRSARSAAGVSIPCSRR
jgi:hypothetical protein